MISYESSGHPIYEGSIRIDNSLKHRMYHNELPHLLEFLLEPQGTHFRVTWDIDQFCAPILNLLTPEQKSELWNTRKLTVGPYELIYNPKKSLSVKKYRASAIYYHLSQYWPDEEPPDLLECARYGAELLESLRGIGIEPRRLSSAIALIDEVFDRFPLPTWQSLPDEVGDLSWNHSGLRWTEAHQLGHWNETWDYDICSSFPFAAAQLLNTTYGSWVQSKFIPEDAIYGWAWCSITINNPVSPIMCKDSKGNLYNPQGTWTGILTLHEMRFIEKWNIGSYVIKEGWFWIPRQRVVPLYWIIQKLYKQRNESPLLKRILKGAMVGIYGRFLQQYSDGSFAPSFFPPWGSMIEVMIRLRVAELIFSMGIQEHMLHIGTDGILTDIQLPITGNGRMGDWRLDHTGPCLILSSGLLFYGNKHPNSITYDRAMSLLNEHPKRREWSTKNSRVMTLGDTVLGSETMGQKAEIVNGFSILPPSEHDRDFNPAPIYGHDVLHGQFRSQPLQAKTLSKKPLDK